MGCGAPPFCRWWWWQQLRKCRFSGHCRHLLPLCFHRTGLCRHVWRRHHHLACVLHRRWVVHDSPCQLCWLHRLCRWSIQQPHDCHRGLHKLPRRHLLQPARLLGPYWVHRVPRRPVWCVCWLLLLCGLHRVPQWRLQQPGHGHVGLHNLRRRHLCLRPWGVCLLGLCGGRVQHDFYGHHGLHCLRHGPVQCRRECLGGRHLPGL